MGRASQDVERKLHNRATLDGGVGGVSEETDGHADTHLPDANPHDQHNDWEDAGQQREGGTSSER